MHDAPSFQFLSVVENETPGSSTIEQRIAVPSEPTIDALPRAPARFSQLTGARGIFPSFALVHPSASRDKLGGAGRAEFRPHMRVFFRSHFRSKNRVANASRRQGRRLDRLR